LAEEHFEASVGGNLGNAMSHRGNAAMANRNADNGKKCRAIKKTGFKRVFKAGFYLIGTIN
jgi:hypothetical protein